MSIFRRNRVVQAAAAAAVVMAGGIAAAAAPAVKEPPSYAVTYIVAAIMCGVVLVIPCKRFRRG
jgi:MFS superfamily sulfate permease-like transporter